MQNNKNPTRELLFAVTANKTVGFSARGIPAIEIIEEARRHYPKLTNNTARTLLNRMVAEGWLNKEGRYYRVHPNHLATVWLDRLRWLEYLKGPAKKYIVDQVKNM